MADARLPNRNKREPAVRCTDWLAIFNHSQHKSMNLYLITQDQNRGYDTYESAVVAAETEEQAKSINPAGERYWKDTAYSS